MQNERDTLACGLRFLKAISQDTLDNFIMKVRMSVDPYECRRTMTQVTFSAKEQHEQAS
jgi:hypothetical protein